MTDIFVFENYFGPSVSNTFHTTHLCIPDTTYMDTFQTHLKPSTHLLHPHKRILCFQAFEILTKLFCLCKTWTFPGNSGSISGYLSAITEINFIQDNRRFHTNERENKTWSSVSNSSFLFVFNKKFVEGIFYVRVISSKCEDWSKPVIINIFSQFTHLR